MSYRPHAQTQRINDSPIKSRNSPTLSLAYKRINAHTQREINNKIFSGDEINLPTSAYLANALLLMCFRCLIQISRLWLLTWPIFGDVIVLNRFHWPIDNIQRIAYIFLHEKHWKERTEEKMKTKQNAKEWMENGTQQNEYMCVCTLWVCSHSSRCFKQYANHTNTHLLKRAKEKNTCEEKKNELDYNNNERWGEFRGASITSHS